MSLAHSSTVTPKPRKRPNETVEAATEPPNQSVSGDEYLSVHRETLMLSVHMIFI